MKYLKELQKFATFFQCSRASTLRAAILCFLLSSGCNSPTETDLVKLTGAEILTNTVNGPLGNSALSVSPSAKAFASQVVSVGSASQLFTVTNTSGYTVTLGTITGDTADFTFTANTCTNGTTLAPSATCSFTIQFLPLSGGNLISTLSIPYSEPTQVTIFSSAVALSGAGTTLVGFNGLTSVSNITTTSMKLNWTGVAGAGTYQMYLVNGGVVTPITSISHASACVAMACSYTVTGLTANTAYTFRGRATDTNGIQELNIATVSGTTNAVGGFTAIPNLAANEGSTAQTGNLSCTDVYASTNAFTITSQSDSTANCTLTAASGANVKVSCTPSYHAAGGVHPNWTDTVTVQCALNGTNYTRTFDVNVTNVNRAPVTQLTAGATQTVSAEKAVTTVTASDTASNSTTDADGDTVTYACTFAGGGFAAGTNCSSLPATSFSMTAGGVFNWTPSLAAAVGGNSTAYTVTISGSDPSAASSAMAFIVMVNPGVNLNIPAGNITSAQMQLSWTNVNGASSYLVYQTIPGPTIQRTTMLASSCGATCTYTVSGLSLSTAYTFRVVAIDSNSAVYSTSLDVSATTLAGKLVFSGSTSVIAGNCGSITITVRDNANAAINIAASTVTIGGKGSGTLWSDAGCTTTSIANPQIGAGTSAVTFYIKDTLVENLTLTAALTNYTSASQAYAISAGTPDHFEYVQGNSQSGYAYKALSTSLKVKVVDFYGNAVSGVNVCFMPTKNPGLAQPFYTTSDSSGFASTTYFPGAGDFSNTIVAKKVGAALPDTAATGNATYSFTETSTFGSKGGNSQNLTTGTSPTGICGGDLDGDGDKDLITIAQASAKANVFLNNGDGTFGTKTDYAVNAGAYTCTTGDFDNDGKLDLVVGGYNAATATTINYLRGNGDGTFQGATSINTNLAGTGVVAGDFNNDGKLDIVVSHYGSANGTTVSLIKGNGDNTFQAKVDYTVGTAPLSVTAGDVNQDGWLDIIAANYQSSSISVLMNNGNGTFAAKVDYATNANPWGVVVGNFNGDAYPDLAVTTYTSSNLSIFLNNGNGTFAAKVDYANASNSETVVAKDINGDGKIDLVTANATANSSLNYFFGNGNGTFQTRVSQNVYVGNGIRDVYIDDFDGDSKLDVVVGLQSNNLIIAMPRITGAPLTGTSTSSYGIAQGDFNNDGNIDLVQSSYSGNVLSVFLGAGNGSFGTKTDFATGTNPTIALTADLNGDGNLDLIASNYAVGVATFSVLLGAGNGSFGARTDFYTTSDGTAGGTKYRPWQGAVTDLNKDGKMDLLFVYYNDAKVSVSLGNGDGTFQNPVYYTTGANPYGVAIEDVNGDGKLDAVTANYSAGTVSVFTGNGDGTLNAKADYATGGLSLIQTAIGDLNADGKPDLVVSAYGSDKVSVLLNSGTGTFPSNSLYTAKGANQALITDFNADGKMDVVVLNATDSTVNFLPGNGTGILGTANVSALPTSCAAQYFVLSDFDKNGKLDIAAACNSTTPISVGIMLGW